MDTPREANDDSRQLALERIVLFSDAVMAIAITLLAIEIRLPDLHGDITTELPRALMQLWPRYLGFVISFLVVGIYWWVHHRIFRSVIQYDEGLIWINIAFLLCVAFIPFASAVLGEHMGVVSAVMFYAMAIATTGIVETLLWVYVSRGHRLIDPALTDRWIRLATMRGLVAPTVFLVSIPISFFSPYVAIALWLLIFPALWYVMRAYAVQDGM